MTHKQRYLAAVHGQPYDRTPATPLVMAWAAHFIGRNYRDYYLQPDILAEAQIAVAEAFDFDMVSVMSDPWAEASHYGMAFDWPEEAVGIPKDHLIHHADDLTKLRDINFDQPGRMVKREQTLRIYRERVGEQRLITGWVEGPIAEYCDLRGLNEAMMDFYENPGMLEDAMNLIVDNAIIWSQRQIAAGADCIGVGDAAASIIGPQLYEQWIFPLQQRLFAGIHDAGAIVKLHICGNINAILPLLAKTGADVIDCDHMVPLDAARQAVGPNVALSGKIDPVEILMHGPVDRIQSAIRQNIADAGHRFIFQPGCEVPPGTPREHVQAIADVIRETTAQHA